MKTFILQVNMALWGNYSVSDGLLQGHDLHMGDNTNHLYGVHMAFFLHETLITRDNVGLLIVISRIF